LTLKATYIGGPTLLLEWAGVRILTDPTFDPAGTQYAVLRKVAGPAFAADRAGRVDLVLLSHDQHADNLDTAGRAALERAGRVVTTAAGAGRLGGKAVGLAPWQSTELLGLRVTATPARHGPPGCEPVMGEVAGFVVERLEAPGPALYVSGDTVWYEGVAEVARRFSIGVAVLHLGDAHVAVRGPHRLTMDAAEGVQAARALRPRAVVPVHFEDWAHFQQGREAARKVFDAADLPCPVVWLERGVETPLPEPSGS
jgi:L-ascorbate metabolism protein UlaG (beta-lactamase superfamily)